MATPSFHTSCDFSKSQMEQLALDTESPEPTHVNTIGALFWLNPEFSNSVIERAVNHILKQEQALRMRMAHNAGEFSQYEMPYSPEELPVRNLEMDQNEMVAYFEREMPGFSFALDAPLYNFCLARAPGLAALRVFFHHIIIDGASIGIFGQMLAEYCESFAKNEIPTGEEHCFTDTIAQEQRLLTEESVSNAREFWQAQFAAQAPQLSTITPASGPIPETEKGERISHTPNLETGRRINAHCKQEDISPAVFFQAVLVLYLHRKNPDISQVGYGATVSNRIGVEQKNMLGNFALELLHRVPVSADDTVRTLYQSVKQASRDSFRHIRYSYEDVLAMVREKKPEVESLRDVQFAYLPPAAGKSVPLHWMPNYCPETSLEVIVFNITDENEFLLVFDYRPSALSRTEAEAAMEEMLTIAEAFIRSPQSGISTLGNASDKKRQTIAEKLTSILKKYSSCPEIFKHSRLGSDLRLDSFDIINIVSEIEESFGLTIKDNDFQQWVTVNDIIEFIIRKSHAAQ